MKKVKYRFYLNYSKEESWVNEMSQKGWHLEKFSTGRFSFVKGEPGKYTYRSELVGNLKATERNEYLSFLEDSGVTVVHEFAGWIYTRKNSDEGSFNLFTNNQSYIDYYSRILKFIFPLFLFNLFMAFTNIYITTLGDGNLDWLQVLIGIMNIIVTILLLFPINFIYKEKSKLQKEQQIFE